MPIQYEQKIFPHLIPPPPETDEDLIEWAKDISYALDDLNRQIVDKLNLHIAGTHAHPAAWRFMRVPRPSFKYSATDKVVVPATAAKPVYFLIGGQIFEIATDLICDLDGTGPGGLDTGAKAANTIYYLYGVNNAGVAALVASVTSPATGPTGYSSWTYLGAFHTLSGSSNIPPFTSSSGKYVTVGPSAQSHSGDTNWNPETYLQPITIKSSFGFLYISGAGGAGDQGQISPVTPGVSGLPTYVILQVNSIENDVFVEVPVMTPGTLYLKTTDSVNTVGYWQYGWVEDPTEYP